jgi:uncharacterized membrane protein YeiH
LLSHDGLWSAAGLAFRYFDLMATLSWALSGAVLAARRGYDFTGIFVIALVSSCGGGLLRDALFLQAGPPALVRTPSYVLLALLASALTWQLGKRSNGRLPRWMSPVMRVADAIGLGAFAVVGMRLALAASIHVAGALLIGVVNAVGGGILRSLLLRRTPEVFRPGEFTALAAFAGTLSYALLAVFLLVDERIAGIVSIVLVAALHWASRRFRLYTRSVFSLEVRRRMRAHSVAPPGPTGVGDGLIPFRSQAKSRRSPRSGYSTKSRPR